MSVPLLFSRLDPAPFAELRKRYEVAPNGEGRTRYQMLLLAQQGYRVPQIARIVLRSEDTVALPPAHAKCSRAASEPSRQ